MESTTYTYRVIFNLQVPQYKSSFFWADIYLTRCSSYVNISIKPIFVTCCVKTKRNLGFFFSKFSGCGNKLSFKDEMRINY